jgi:hypothetical protein
MWRIWPELGLGFQGLGDGTDEVLTTGIGKACIYEILGDG